MRIPASWLCCLLLFGVASAVEAQKTEQHRQYDSESRIGLINVIEERFMHYHQGVSVLTSYYNFYPIDWKISDTLLGAFEEISTAEITKIDTPGWFPKKPQNIYRVGWTTPVLKKKYARRLEALCEAHALDVIVIVRTEFSAALPSRFGLFTQGEFFLDRPLYAHIRGVHLDSIDCNPVTRNITINDKAIYTDPSLIRPPEAKEMPAEQIAAARPMIERMAIVLAYKLAAGLGVVSPEDRERYDAVLNELEKRKQGTLILQ